MYLLTEAHRVTLRRTKIFIATAVRAADFSFASNVNIQVLGSVSHPDGGYRKAQEHQVNWPVKSKESFPTGNFI